MTQNTPTNVFEMNTEQVLRADVSGQERIRLLFRLGHARSEIAKMLTVKYQIVFKATNPKYAPARWRKVLTVRLEQERAAVAADIPEVELIDSAADEDLAADDASVEAEA
jgi:hypothetical protein